MATHGLILGGLAGVVIFCLLRRKPMLVMLDALAIPAALILCVGRIGNFIDGQIVGTVTDVPWAVKFPDADGFRHPVVLYDGLKNLLIVPVLMHARRRGVPRAGSRRASCSSTPSCGSSSTTSASTPDAARPAVRSDDEHPDVGGGRRAALAQPSTAMARITLPQARRTRRPVVARALFAWVVLGSMVIASDATRDIAARYGPRHPGLAPSRMYPAIPAPPQK